MSRTTTALVLMCIASPLAAQSFEGTVTMNITSDNGAVRPISYMLKGGKIRFDAVGTGPAGPMSVIIDPASQHMMMIITSRKMYMETDFGGAVAAAQQQAAGKNPSITRTGKMETIAGYSCEHVMVTDDDGTSVDTCISSELGGFRMPTASNPMAPQREAGWLTQLGSGKFPLKVQKGGKTVMEVTAIEKKSLDAALFAAPDGFQSFSMPGMPRKPPQGK
jgi:hypothetical protein